MSHGVRVDAVVDVEGCCLVVTTGGTGPAKRDVTPEATEAVADKLMPGFGELMRATSLKVVPTAILSRRSRPHAIWRGDLPTMAPSPPFFLRLRRPWGASGSTIGSSLSVPSVSGPVVGTDMLSPSVGQICGSCVLRIRGSPDRSHVGCRPRL